MATDRGMSRRVGRRELFSRFMGNSMLALGGSLFGVAAAYEIYSRRAEAGLAGLRRGNYQLPGQPQVSAVASSSDTAPATAQPATATPSAETGTAAATAVPGVEPDLPATAPAQQAADVTPEMLPVKLTIAAIGLKEARVVEVGTRIEKGQLVWETADHAVGHHTGTAVPGRDGNCVLSGHISSPVKGEGNIFRSLPNLADNIGSTASVQTLDGSWYHYKIVGTDVVTPSDTAVLNPTPKPMLTLLTCVPDGVYTYRFVALGEYMGKS